MKRYTYKPGDWNVICQVCGNRFPASKIQKRWDGLLVCKEDYETRHPQDLIRVPQEDTSVPYLNPEVPVFNVCNDYTRLGIVGIGVADCAIVGRTSSVYLGCSESSKVGIAGLAVASCGIPMYEIDGYIL